MTAFSRLELKPVGAMVVDRGPLDHNSVDCPGCGRRHSDTGG